MREFFLSAKELFFTCAFFKKYNIKICFRRNAMRFLLSI